VNDVQAVGAQGRETFVAGPCLREHRRGEKEKGEKNRRPRDRGHGKHLEPAGETKIRFCFYSDAEKKPGKGLFVEFFA
jgi:hypothetical protein